jgi:hypothetical protein
MGNNILFFKRNVFFKWIFFFRVPIVFRMPVVPCGRLILCIFLMSSGVLAGFTQQPYHFTTALSASVGAHYGREALYTDPLAWQLYSHTLKRPAAGDTFGINAKGQEVVWQALKADSLNRFRLRGTGGGGFGAAWGGGYLYLSYVSDRERTALLNVGGDASLFFNGVPHGGDPYSSGWLYIPVKLKKGLNECYIRPSGPVTASLVFPDKEMQLNTEDPTMPVIQADGAGKDSLYGAVVVINSSSKALKGYRIRSVLEGKTTVSEIPVVPAMSSRKVPFVFNASAVTAKGHFKCALSLLAKDKSIDEKEVTIDAAGAGEQYSTTFISGIDGSLQYYAVTPQSPDAAARQRAG